MRKQLPRNLDYFERLSSYGGVPRVQHNPRQILILYAERKRGLCGIAVPGYRQGVKLTGRCHLRTVRQLRAIPAAHCYCWL